VDNTDAVSSVNGYVGTVSLVTGDVLEGAGSLPSRPSQLYFTDARARLALSAGTGISYDNTTGVITNASPDQTVALTGAGTTSISGTYPNFTITSNDQFVGTVTSVGTSAPLTGGTITTTGTIGITQSSSVADGYLSSTDWNTFSNKQNALTNPVTGTGTTNFIPKFTGASTIGNSAITDDGTTVTLIGRALSGTSATFSANMNADDYNMAAWKILDWTGSVAQIGGIGSGQWNQIDFFTSGTSKMILNSSGNLGLGVTPSAWGSGRTAIQIGNDNSYLISNRNLVVGNNAFNNGTNWIYLTSGVNANLYAQLEGGDHAWYTAPSGTAGNVITFTQAMTLDASGRLSIGNTSVSAINERLNVTGNGISIEDTDGGREMLLGHFGGADGILGTFTNDTLQIRTNNTARLTIASTGAATFSSSVTAAQFVANGASTVPNLILNGPSTTWTRYQTSGTDRWDVGNNVGGLSSNQFSFFSNGASSNVLVIQQNGNVGIGNVASNARLYISANAGVDVLNVAGYDVLKWDTGDILTFGGYKSGQWNAVAFATTGAESMRITSGGNVLVGTTTDAGYKLDVSGTGRFTSNLLAQKVQVGTAATINDATGVGNTLQFANYSAGVFVTGSADSYIYKTSSVFGGLAAQTLIFQTRSDVAGGGFAFVGGSTPSVIAKIDQTGAATFSSSVQTGAPSGGTAKPIKFGAVQAASSLTGDALQIEVDGVTYLLGIVSPP
jgi:hypothetical protein